MDGRGLVYASIPLPVSKLMLESGAAIKCSVYDGGQLDAHRCR